jgi:hypothetical protein
VCVCVCVCVCVLERVCVCVCVCVFVCVCVCVVLFDCVLSYVCLCLLSHLACAASLAPCLLRVYVVSCEVSEAGREKWLYLVGRRYGVLRQTQPQARAERRIYTQKGGIVSHKDCYKIKRGTWCGTKNGEGRKGGGLRGGGKRSRSGATEKSKLMYKRSKGGQGCAL